LFRTVGYGGDSGSISDIEQADLVLIIGSNTAESHPVLATRVKQSHKLRGQKLIVADLRRHEMAERADVFLHPRPGTDLIWLSAVTRWIFDNGLAKTDFLKQWVNGVDEYRKSLEPFTMQYASERTGLPEETLGASGADDRRSEERVRAVGDGGDAALDGVGHIDGDFGICCWRRELHAAGNGRVSAARAQQRAGSEPITARCQIISRLPKRRRSGDPGEVREGVGRERCRRSRGSTITR